MSKNVLLVTVDSLRYDAAVRLRERNSALGSLAERGTWFSNAYATGPGTTPSFPALLCGTMPLSYEGLGPLSADRPRISAAFQTAGYDTGGFHCNPFLSTQFGYDEGFDAFEDYQHPLTGVAARLFPRGIELRNPTLQGIDERLGITDAIKRGYQFVSGKPRPYVSADVVTEDALSWLDGRETFFCWVHYMDVHHPCYPPSAYRDRFDVPAVSQTDVSEWYSTFVRDPETLGADELDTLERLYEAAIAYTDDQIARIINELEASGQLAETLVVYTADHGELFGDHGAYGKPERLYDELLHVPLVVVNGPEAVTDASDDLVSLLDIPPLIHSATGVDQPPGYEGTVPGKGSKRQYVLAEHELQGDVIVGGRSETRRYEADEIRDDRRLVDMTTEKPERIPLETQTPEEDRLVRAVEDRRQRVSGRRSTDADLPSDIEERLDHLGYR